MCGGSGFALDVKGSRIPAGVQLSIFTNLNLLDGEVLIKIRVANSHCLYNARDSNENASVQTVWHNQALGFMGEQMITSE